MKSASFCRFIGVMAAVLACGFAGQASAVKPTRVVASDIRPVGNGQCVAAVAVSYEEPIQSPWAKDAPLLSSARRQVPCAKAQTAAEGLVRGLETDLLLRAQLRADDENARVHSVWITDSANVRTQAMAEAPVMKVLPAGTRLNVRSVTPIWYGITDARGMPTGGFLHYSEFSHAPSAAAHVWTVMTAACQTRVRAAPRMDAAVVQSLKCGQAVKVTPAARGWFEVASADEQPSKRYIYSAMLNPEGNRMQ